MKKIYTLFSAIGISASLYAQLQLKPAIGPVSLPNDNDAICAITCSASSWNFNTDGLLVGDTIPQFQFYSLNGTPADALSLLQTGKPLCIVAGSFTCPVWRGKIAALNTLVSTYNSQVNFLVVYVVEAHPNTPDVSPYSCQVWTTSQNQTDGVLYLQPTTYGGKKQIAADMMNNTCTCIPAINAPMVIDGPCNDFWLTFGPAPNNAYLINPLDGTVACKHGWFNQAPLNMATCIDSLLQVLSVNEQSSKQASSVFPNPFSAAAVIKTESPAANAELKVFDMFGKEVMKQEVPSGTKNIPVARGNLTAGIYFYTLENKEGTLSSGKFIIE